MCITDRIYVRRKSKISLKSTVRAINHRSKKQTRPLTLTTSGGITPRHPDTVQKTFKSEHFEAEADRRFVEMTRIVDAAVEEIHSVVEPEFSDARAEHSVRVCENRTTSGIPCLLLCRAVQVVGWRWTFAKQAQVANGSCILTE
jgi:hypothetical protein